MFKFLKLLLTDEEISAVIEKAEQTAISGDKHAVLIALKPIIDIQAKQRAAALALVKFIDRGHLSTDHSLSLLNDIENAHSNDIGIISNLGFSLEEACEIDFLNRSSPDHPLFRRVIETLSRADLNPDYTDSQKDVLLGLATAARMAGLEFDEIAEQSYKKLIALEPTNCDRYYGYGLFLKTRGRFQEGLEQNQKALALASKAVDAYEWNLGICATGAGAGQVALDIWRRKGNNLELGRFDLPEGRYPQCKVRLAERPLAERTADNDDPGIEETVWIERLSPCHGIIRSVLYQDLGVNYGDVVLFDGAPVTYHTYGNQKIAVFPHLATIKRMDYRFYDFAGTQSQEKQLMKKSAAIPLDAVIYSHTEQYQTLCATCWTDPDIDHTNHKKVEKSVVVGKLAAPPTIDAVELLQSLDKAFSESDACSIYVPNLCKAAGEEQRSEVERRRFDILVNN